MTTELSIVILLALVISVSAGIVIWRHTRTLEANAVDADAEARRFQLEPRVGDRAGYYAGTEDEPNAFWVGEVTHVDHAGRVELSVPIVTPFGSSVQSGWWNVDSLRWFPPDTPLGLYVEGDQSS